MLLLYIGGVELGDGLQIQFKVTETARTVTDLASQYITIQSSDMSNILTANPPLSTVPFFQHDDDRVRSDDQLARSRHYHLELFAQRNSVYSRRGDYVAHELANPQYFADLG